MTVRNNHPFIYQNRSDFARQTGLIAKCAVLVTVIALVAKNIFNVDYMTVGALLTISFIASVLFKGALTHLRSDAIIAQHKIIEAGSQ